MTTIEGIIKSVASNNYTIASEDLSAEENALYLKFCKVAQSAFNKHPNSSKLADPYQLAQQCDINLAKIHKDSQLSPAIWTAYLCIFVEQLLRVHGLKYQSLESFIESYDHRFTDKEDHPREEQLKLFAIANLMNIYFNYVPAKKNKGLILQVIPRVVEGWKVKYITGSGQTIATKDRVHIYESEGNVKPFHRGKDRGKLNEVKYKSTDEPVPTKVSTRPNLNTKKRAAPYDFTVSHEEAQRRFVHNQIMQSLNGETNPGATTLRGCPWNDSMVALARSYSLSDTTSCGATITNMAMASEPTALPTNINASAYEMTPFEQQQAAIKQQIIEAQGQEVQRVPSFDTAFPPALGSPISREVSWDKDLNGPGDNSTPVFIAHPVAHPFWF